MSIAQAGSPIRKSTDIADICSSPWLIAACHVLRRLLMPRHSPCALSSLTSRIILLILKVELCRQFNRIFEIVIVTHLYDVPQLKLKIRSSRLLPERPLCCLAYHFIHYIVQFSRFDLPTAFAARSEDPIFRSSDPTTTVVSVSRPPDEIRLYLALHARCNLLVGPSGLEPPTLRLSVVRSSQLSYGPLSTWWR